jgi:hypothetical protein
MPVLNKKDLMSNIKMWKVEYEVDGIFDILVSLNKLLMKINDLKKRLIVILVK